MTAHADRPRKIGPRIVALAAIALVAGPVAAVSRLDDGALTLAVSDGVPCFGVDRYLGDPALIFTREFDFQPGSTELRSIRVVDANSGQMMWRVMMSDGGVWSLESGQCVRYGASPPVRPHELLAARALVPGHYMAFARVHDTVRDRDPRLSASFCVLADGRMLNLGRGRGGEEECRSALASSVVADGAS